MPAHRILKTHSLSRERAGCAAKLRRRGVKQSPQPPHLSAGGLPKHLHGAGPRRWVLGGTTHLLAIRCSDVLENAIQTFTAAVLSMERKTRWCVLPAIGYVVALLPFVRSTCNFVWVLLLGLFINLLFAWTISRPLSPGLSVCQ